MSERWVFRLLRIVRRITDDRRVALRLRSSNMYKIFLYNRYTVSTKCVPAYDAFARFTLLRRFNEEDVHTGSEKKKKGECKSQRVTILHAPRMRVSYNISCLQIGSVFSRSFYATSFDNSWCVIELKWRNISFSTVEFKKICTCIYDCKRYQFY